MCLPDAQGGRRRIEIATGDLGPVLGGEVGCCRRMRGGDLGQELEGSHLGAPRGQLIGKGD